MTRRDAVRRAVVLGGSLAVTAPAVQGLGVVRALAQTSPPPPPPPQEGAFPSNVQLIVDCGAGSIGVKFDEGDSPAWDRIGRGGACGFTHDYRDPTDQELADLAAGAVVDKVVDAQGAGTYVLTLPDGCSFIEGRAKDGTCGGPHGDGCGAPVDPNADGTLSFSTCD